MLETLKERITELGEGLKEQVLRPEAESTQDQKLVTFNAGADLLAHFQDGWRRIHEGAEQVARLASKTDREVGHLHVEYEKQWRHMAMLSGLVSSCLPALNRDMENIMRTAAELESLFMEVEVSLFTLENTIDTREVQERQLEQRFQLAIYEERRRQEMDELGSQLEVSFRRQSRDFELKKMEKLRRRQTELQASFEEDMNNFSKTGLLSLPKSYRVTDVSLESIDLDEDGGALEQFLDDCPGASPLPRDDIPLVQEELGPPSPIDRLPSPTSPVRLVVSSPGGDDDASRPNSVYFTPDVTLENMTSQDANSH